MLGLHRGHYDWLLSRCRHTKTATPQMKYTWQVHIFNHWSNVNDFTKYHINPITTTQIIQSEPMTSLKGTKLCSQPSEVSLLTEIKKKAFFVWRL